VPSSNLASEALEIKANLSSTVFAVPLIFPSASITATCISSFTEFLLEAYVDVLGAESKKPLKVQEAKAVEFGPVKVETLIELPIVPGYLAAHWP